MHSTPDLESNNNANNSNLPPPQATTSGGYGTYPPFGSVDDHKSATDPSAEPAVPWSEDPRISATLMILTYLSAAAGFGLGVYELTSKEVPSLDVATILVVTIAGALSFLRHSVFHRSDEARIGWKAPEGRSECSRDGNHHRYVNFFLIEVGLANLSWALLGLLSVVCHWGLAIQAASFLVFGMYIGQVAVLLLVLKVTQHPQALDVGPMVAMTSFAGMLLYVGSSGMMKAMMSSQ